MEAVITENMWRAIVECDSSHDGKFFYGVSTTGIFCRPSCKSRTPSKDNIRIFREVREALGQHYRPCKRCRPEGIRLPEEEWVDRIAGWIRDHQAEPITLERLAGEFHTGSSHLQRTFKRIQGVSPAVYLQHIRLTKAQKLLETAELSITAIAVSTGFSSAAHFATLFLNKTGLTPSQYRQRKAESG